MPKERGLEESIYRIFKKIVLLMLGSGLITNAAYIYGLAYYEGYIETLGFEYDLFPIQWNETLLWTYWASRELGASTVSFWTKLTTPIVIFSLVVVYLIARLWMSVSASSKNQKKSRRNFKFSRWLVKCRRARPKRFKLFYYPVRWFFTMESSIWAFIASYFFLLALLVVPILVFIWVYFPLIGVKHGVYVGEYSYDYYQKNMCGSFGDKWEKCISFDTKHIGTKNLPSVVSGRLILKNGNLLALVTSSGPVTMTIPSQYYHKAQINFYSRLDCRASVCSGP